MENAARNDKPIDYITLMNVISAISVVILHTNCFWGTLGQQSWWYANIIECVFYFAVPIFFMITGATLIDYQERYSTKIYFKKRIFKTVIPFIFWSVVSFLISFIKAVIYHDQAFLANLKPDYIINGIVNGNFTYIYWFFIPLFCIYACIPLFSAVEKEKKRQIFKYLAVICFIVNIFIPFVIEILKYYGIHLEWKYCIYVGMEYLFYVIAGYLLHNINIKFNTRCMFYVLGMIGLFLHIFGTYVLSNEKKEIVFLFKGYNNVPCVWYSIGFFIFIKYLSKKITSKTLVKIVLFFRPYTFAIYLVHIFFLPCTNYLFKIINVSTNSLLYIFGTPVILIAICIVITYIMRKIPLVKYFVP